MVPPLIVTTTFCFTLLEEIFLNKNNGTALLFLVMVALLMARHWS